LPAGKILVLFRKGYADMDGFGKINHSTYDHLVIGVAPGGVVVVWLQGRFFKTEIGRYQAKDTVVNKNEFLPHPDPEETQQQFYDWWFNHNTTPEIREQLKTAGFPYGLWDKYRLKYNWRLHMQFYKPTDKDTLRYNTYVNGEEDAFYKNELAANSYLERPVPFGMHIFFANNLAKILFDEKETMAAFAALAKDNKNTPIELIAKVQFQNTGLTFVLKSGTKEIPLVKAVVQMHRFN